MLTLKLDYVVSIRHDISLVLHCLFNYQSDPAFADRIRLARDAKRRMAAVWSYCKGKMVCEADAEPDEADSSEQPEIPKRGHGGRGHVQPQIRKENLKLFLQYRRSKNDEDEEFKAAQPDKRPFTPAEVFNILRKISDDELALLGLSEEYARPVADWMILTVLPVPPPPVRPSTSTDVPCLRVREQRHCWDTSSSTKVWSIRQSYSRSFTKKGKEGRLRGNLIGQLNASIFWHVLSSPET
ncbi:RPO21_2 [Sanghuangporus weigelae]